MERFCGSKFWDSTVTWDTDDPNFTRCMENTVIAWTPCAFLWLTSVFEIFYALRSKRPSIPNSGLNIFQRFFTLVLLVLEVCNIAITYRKSTYTDFKIYDVDRVTPAVKAITFALAFGLQTLNKRKGVYSSGILFIFWLAVVVCGVFRYQSELRALPIDKENEHELFWFVILMISYPLSVIQLILHFFADTMPEEKPVDENSNEGSVRRKISPEATASFPSQVTFQWFWPMAYLGYKKPLEFTDLWDLNPEDKSRNVVDHFNDYWVPDLQKAKQKFGFEPASKKEDPEKGTLKGASILSSLWKANGGLFLLGVLLKLVQDLLTFVSPRILDLLIGQVGSDMYEWKGYFYAALLFVVVMVQTLFLGQYFHKMFIVGMRIRSALVGAIYRKSLVLSNAARKESTLGEIVNLMSVDSQRFVDLTTYINMIWSAPLQIALSLYFLWTTLGPSVLAGVAVMILLIPINLVIANRVKRLQIRQMKNKDERVKLMNEILSGIKVLKLYAWEPSFEEQVNKIRQRELRVLKLSAYLQSFSVFVWLTAPFLVSVVTFATYVLVDDENVLDSRKAFVSLTYFNIMRMPMSILPNILVFIVEANVSLKRINKFMNAAEISPDDVTHNAESDGTVVSVRDGNFSWDETPTLQDINFEVKKGSLVAVVGSVGSGKTSLLSAILGEMERKGGKVNTFGSIAYVAQQAWIQNATLRDNVLFGSPFEQGKYDKIIEACALKPDLKILPGGDRTEIGEKGINLSGGQKQRVAIARAAYNDADIYLLDDPLSAVDSHVGKHLFEKVIGPKGMLDGKTRVIVTHSVTYLPKMDSIVVMNDGKITEVGTFNELLDRKGAFADFLVHHAAAEDLEEVADETTIESIEKVIGGNLERQRSRVSESESNVGGRRISTSSISSRKSALVEDAKLERQQSIMKGKDNKEKLIEAEVVETGKVKRDVYRHYLHSVSMTYGVSSVVLLIAMQGFSMGSSIWLAEWTKNTNKNSTDTTKDRDLYLGVYGALGLGQAIAALFGNALMALGCLRAAQFLHHHMLTNIIRSPMSFFDTTPLGRIVNRFSKDVDVADSTFPANLRSWLQCLLQVLSTFIIISYNTPWFIVVILPLGVIYYVVQRFYVSSSRQLKRLESQSRSPIYSHFSETLTGTMTIRAFGAQDQFILQSESTVDHNQVSYYPSIIANRWLAVRLETVGNLIILFAALFAVISDNDEGSLGLSVSYALNITQTLNWLVRMTSDVETNVVAVERIKEYGEVPQEAAWEVPGKKPPSNWPHEGMVKFNNYQTRYREGLELVLKGVSCTIQPGEKVGIVGRTGAGKSSLTLGLFRIIEAAGGSIEIDGQKLSNLGLHDVRGKLTIIPQDPVLFSGTLRMNLDPFEKYNDDEVWHALEYAHLKGYVKSLASGLDHKVSEGGENLSVGQRQLVCLARALLRKTKILILDEATAAVDLETDDLIQQTIRSEFKDCTVLTIAHRLNTIIDSNRVMVLDKGDIKEISDPQDLLKDKNSIFYGMAKDAGLV